MNNRERFYQTLHYGNPDRVPYFEEGIREDVIAAWKEQGMPEGEKPWEQADIRQEIKLDTDPYPRFETWPRAFKELEGLHAYYDPSDPRRLPDNWDPERLQGHDEVLMVRVHEGLFLSMGVGNARTFTRLMYQLADQPDFVRAYMRMMGEFAVALAEPVLQAVQFDALVFSEPIGDNNGALISPRMYEDLVLPGYQPLLDLARRYGIKTIICRTYANMKALIPSLLKWGIDVLWACEVEPSVMNYPALRQEFGRDLKLIGGIDLDALRKGKDAIKKELTGKVPELLQQGGYIPLADGRIRSDVSYENYVYYRNLLEKIIRDFSD